MIADPQITASSVLEWTDHTGRENSWKPEKARLKQPGPPWAAFAADEYQWLQIDLNKEKKITGWETYFSRMIPGSDFIQKPDNIEDFHRKLGHCKCNCMVLNITVGGFMKHGRGEGLVFDFY